MSMSIRQQAEFEKMKHKVEKLEEIVSHLLELVQQPEPKRGRPRKENGEAHA